MFGPAFLISLVTVSGCRPILIIVLICFAMALNSFCYSGYNVTHVDMSPEFASTLFGISSTVAYACGIFAPTLVGLLTSDGETIPEWNRVFFSIAVIYVICGVFFNVFGSAEKQPWGPDDDDAKLEMSF
ncbi:putative inorganic phosphate cotransporter [Caerostris darwini]|nr:putative inorganic phosphate cotransporter [Caerostris darwini]GIZ02084.1 putative inorganic phosphate cotransporter [Caerostris extrusa]